MRLRTSILLVCAFTLLPAAAFADSFQQNVLFVQQRVAALSDDQLAVLNMSVYTDAFVAARIVGFDRSEIDQMKRDIQSLKQDNADLHAQLSARPAAVSSPAPASSLEPRIAALETKMTSLQGTLGLVVNMLTALLAKLQ